MCRGQRPRGSGPHSGETSPQSTRGPEDKAGDIAGRAGSYPGSGCTGAGLCWMCRSLPSREGKAERTAPQGGDSPGADTTLGSVHREPGPTTGSLALGRHNPGSVSLNPSMRRLTAWPAGPQAQTAPLPRSAREGCREQGRRACRGQSKQGVRWGRGSGDRAQASFQRNVGPTKGPGDVGGGIPVGPGFAAGKLRPGGWDALACAGGAGAPGWGIQPEGGLGHSGGAPGSLGQGGSLGDDLIR